MIVQRIEARAAADGIDRLEAPGRNEPRPRIGGDAIARPVLEGGTERLMQRFLGEIEIAEEPDQGGEDAPRLGPVDRVHRVARVLGRFPAHAGAVSVVAVVVDIGFAEG
ncbi:hypothetical protein D3C83_30790 [compost metagenome]